MADSITITLPDGTRRELPEGAGAGELAASIGRGLAQVEPETGTLVAYAAKVGQIAYDGDGQNSPFVTSLLKRLPEPGVEINMLLRAVRDDVLRVTAKKQEPFV